MIEPTDFVSFQSVPSQLSCGLSFSSLHWRLLEETARLDSRSLCHADSDAALKVASCRSTVDSVRSLLRVLVTSSQDHTHHFQLAVGSS